MTKEENGRWRIQPGFSTLLASLIRSSAYLEVKAVLLNAQVEHIEKCLFTVNQCHCDILQNLLPHGTMRLLMVTVFVGLFL